MTSKRPHTAADIEQERPTKRQASMKNFLLAARTPRLPESAQEKPLLTDAAAPADTSSKTLAELRVISKNTALQTWKRLVNGYTDKSNSGYEPAVREENGCLLAQKAPNRDVNGYVQIAPIVPTLGLRSRNGQRKQKPMPQNAHRLAVVAHLDTEAVNHLLYDYWHASHLCGRPTCIEPNHIAVEPKSANESRKGCRDK
ncbi:hypothetical protein MY4824_010140, partial [Beauveria thailandica]